MAYKKIYVALDCKDADEARKMQQAAEDLSATFAMSAGDILAIYPYVKKNARLIRNTIQTLSKKGVRGLGSIVADMMANFKS